MRGWPLAAVLITVLVLVFATVGLLYAAGPAYECRDENGHRTQRLFCERDETQFRFERRRTNAWERIKGAVTGEP